MGARPARPCDANGKLQTTCTDNGQSVRKFYNLDATPKIKFLYKPIHQLIYEIKLIQSILIKLSQNLKYLIDLHQQHLVGAIKSLLRILQKAHFIPVLNLLLGAILCNSITPAGCYHATVTCLYQRHFTPSKFSADTGAGNAWKRELR